MTQPDSLAPDAASAGPATGSELDRLVSVASSFPLPVFRQNYRHLRDRLHVQTRSLWLQGGGTLPTAKKIALVVTGGQQLASHMAQLYVRNHLGANFTPFDPGPGITERPGVDKVEEYLRPAREVDTGKALRRLQTLVSTDLQLTKTRTFYSAFDEDINQNRKSIKLYRRVPGGEKPCALCEIAADQVYFTDDLMAIHDNCECDIEEDDGTRLSDDDLKRHHVGFVETLINSGDQKKVFESLAEEDAGPEAYHNLVKVEQHGELGPVLTWKGQKFTGPADLPVPKQARPLPVVGPGARHEERMQANAARVAAYRRSRGLHETPNVGSPQPQWVKPKHRPIDMGSMGRVAVSIGPDGHINLEDLAPHELPPVKLDKFDWDHLSGEGLFHTQDDLSDALDYMREKFRDRMGLDPFSRQDGWTSTRYPIATQMKTLHALDEIWTKYPDVNIARLKIADLGPGNLAETMTRIDVPGDTEYIGFSRAIMQKLPSEAQEMFKDRADEGFYFEGADEDPYRAMVYHEFAHALDNRGGWKARATMTKDMRDLFFKSKDGQALTRIPHPTNGDIKAHFEHWLRHPGRVSGYSMEDGRIPGDINTWGTPAGIVPNPPEAIAQAFDDYERRGEAASDLSKLLHDRLVEEAHGSVPDDWAFTAQVKQSAVQRLSDLKEVKTTWSLNDYMKEDNHKLSAEQRTAALTATKGLLQRALKVEPAITAAARAVVEQQGGYMSGLDFRLKTGPSLYRKIQAEMLEQHIGAEEAAADIKDAVRYTGVFQPEGFWDSGSKLREAIKSLGATVIKDPVGVPLNGYRGRNMAFKLHGVDFEMQTNTDLGVATKDECHKIFNVSRKLDKVDPERIRMENEMQQKWDTIPITQGTPVVQTEKDAKSGDPNKVMYVADSTKYRGPTVPGGESELGSPEMLDRERVPSVHYGMNWLPDSGNEKVVERARALTNDQWDTLPVQQLPWGTTIEANEGTLKKKSIDKVVGGKEPFREGYIIKLWRDDKGNLHVVDGHTRIGMYYALNKDMPVRIMDEETYSRLTGATTEDRLAVMTDRPMDTKPVDAMGEKPEPVRGQSYGPGGKFDAPFPLDPKDVEPKGIGFLDHDHMVANILARYNDTTGDKAWIRQAGAAWYPAARGWVLKMLDATGSQLPLDKAAAVVAQYSENASWVDNMARAMNWFSGKPSGAFKATDARTKAIAESDDPLSMVRGPKVNNFVRAILGFDRFPDAVAVDRWAARIALGNDDKALASKLLGRTGGYEAMANAYRDAARQLGIPPSELQAVTWVHAVPADATVRAFKEAGEWHF